MFTSAELQHREHLIKQILHLSDAKDYYDLADTLDSHSTEYLEQELQKLKDKVPINYQQEKLLRTLFGLWFAIVSILMFHLASTNPQTVSLFFGVMSFIGMLVCLWLILLLEYEHQQHLKHLAEEQLNTTDDLSHNN